MPCAGGWLRLGELCLCPRVSICAPAGEGLLLRLPQDPLWGYGNRRGGGYSRAWGLHCLTCESELVTALLPLMTLPLGRSEATATVLQEKGPGMGGGLG